MAIGLELFNTAITNLNFGSLQVEKVDFGNTNVWTNSTNALFKFREGVSAVDVFTADSLVGITAIDNNILGTFTSDGTRLGSTDELSMIEDWSAFNGATLSVFLRDRTPIGSFVLLWRDDSNFALYEVDSHLFNIEAVDVVSVEAMVSVGTLGTGPASLYVFSDTAAFLRSVESVNGVWQPREFTRIVINVDENFEIAFNTTTNRYEPDVVGGDGVLRYAWTVESEGKSFRMDRNTAVPGTTGQSRLYLNGTEALANNVGGDVTFRIFDDNQTSSYTTNTGFGFGNLSDVAGGDIWFSNWEDPEGVISVDADAPAGTVVTSVAVGLDFDPFEYQWSFDGDLAEYSPYTFNGEGDHGGTIFGSSQTYDITKISSDIIPLVGNDISQFAVDITVIGGRNDADNSQDISIIINR